MDGPAPPHTNSFQQTRCLPALFKRSIESFRSEDCDIFFAPGGRTNRKLQKRSKFVENSFSDRYITFWLLWLALTHLQIFYFPKLVRHLKVLDSEIEETAATSRAFEGLLLPLTIQNMNDARKFEVCTIFSKSQTTIINAGLIAFNLRHTFFHAGM